MKKILITRSLLYSLGLFIMAIGVSVSKISNLGVSPVNSIPCVISSIVGINMGVCTTIVFILFIGIQILIMRRDFKWHNLLQILCSTLFGFFVSLTNSLVGICLPECNNYIIQLVYILISIVLVALGILFYIEANILSLPAEGVMQALSHKTGIPLSTSKIIFDISVVVIATIFSLLFLHELNGVREGTIIAAIGVGPCLRSLTKHLKKPLNTLATDV